jgi:glutamate decarboxylase
VIRLVIRNGFSRDVVDILLDDIGAAVGYFDGLSGPMAHDPAHTPSFHH